MLTKQNDEAATGIKTRRSNWRFRGRRLDYGVIRTSLQRLHSKRKQSFRGKGKRRPKPLVLLAVLTTWALQENELKAHLRGTRDIYTWVADHTRMFRDMPVNVWKCIEWTGTLWKLVESGRIIQRIDESEKENWWVRVTCDHHVSLPWHPQTDGQSECTNQWLEQYLRIYGNYKQDDWATWLPMAQYVQRSWPNATTNKMLFGLLIEHTPSLPDQPIMTNVPLFEDRQCTLECVREQAQQSIKAAQNTLQCYAQRKKGQCNYRPFYEGKKVWLEETNLKTTHLTAKLSNKRHGHFLVTKVVSPVVFKLWLPASWKIHDIFHASLLSPYKETEKHSKNFEEHPPDLIEGETEYKVNQMLVLALRHQLSLNLSSSSTMFIFHPPSLHHRLAKLRRQFVPTLQVHTVPHTSLGCINSCCVADQ
jgi:hypothetical protein